MILPARSQLASQADHADGASGGCHQGRPCRNPAPSTSARSNGTTSSSTASTSSEPRWSAKERVLMLYFNTNVGATLSTSDASRWVLSPGQRPVDVDAAAAVFSSPCSTPKREYDGMDQSASAGVYTKTTGCLGSQLYKSPVASNAEGFMSKNSRIDEFSPRHCATRRVNLTMPSGPVKS